jgi:ABC-type uncharacterized transport system permease subunit
MIEGMLEVWLSNHDTLTYLPEPGFVVGLAICVLVIGVAFTIREEEEE